MYRARPYMDDLLGQLARTIEVTTSSNVAVTTELNRIGDYVRYAGFTTLFRMVFSSCNLQLFAVLHRHHYHHLLAVFYIPPQRVITDPIISVIAFLRLDSNSLMKGSSG